MPELLQIPFSPWSEKARWALDLSGVRYDSRDYLPLLGELELRVRLGHWRGPVSVPLLRDGKRVYADSSEIARYADRQAKVARLFPPDDEERVAYYSELSERGMSAARALALRRMLRDDEALLELMPAALRRPKLLATWVATFGVQRTLRKYRGHLDEPAVHEAALGEVLDALRTGLASSPSRSEPRTLLAELSYADIAMAQVLAMISPPSAGLRLGPASRRVYREASLAERYADLVAWRDALYAHHRAAREVAA